MDVVQWGDSNLRQKGLVDAINSECAAKGAVKFLLEGLDLGVKSEVSKVQCKLWHNSRFPQGEDGSWGVRDIRVLHTLPIA